MCTLGGLTEACVEVGDARAQTLLNYMLVNISLQKCSLAVGYQPGVE